MFVFDIPSFILADVLGYQSINNKLIKLFHSIKMYMVYYIAKIHSYWMLENVCILYSVNYTGRCAEVSEYQ